MDYPYKIGAFTSVCEEDAHFLPKYLAETERVGMDFVMHFDKCSPATKFLVIKHPRCVGITENNGPNSHFDEMHKQPALDLLVSLGYDWAVNWDADETWERDAVVKMQSLSPGVDVYDYKWVNLWDDPRFIRVDGPLANGHRARFYNLKSGARWEFYNPKINGARADFGKYQKLRGETHLEKLDLVSIHWGMLTKEMRAHHKKRWDFLYGRHTDDGKNPYGFWEWACDESITPELVEHGYF